MTYWHGFDSVDAYLRARGTPPRESALVRPLPYWCEGTGCGYRRAKRVVKGVALCWTCLKARAPLPPSR